MATFQLLRHFVSLEFLMLTSAYWTLFQECNADASWNSLALCLGCTDKRLVVPGNLFQPRLIGKGSSLIWARIDCGRSCANQESCYAFNFYENENVYVCELLSDSFHRNRTPLQLNDHPGCSVWEKLSTGMDSDVNETSTGTTPEGSTETTQSSTGTSPMSSTGNNWVSDEISTKSTHRTSTETIQSNTETSQMSNTGINSISTQLSSVLMPGATAAMVQSSTGTNSVSSAGKNLVTDEISTELTSGASTEMTQSCTGTCSKSSTGKYSVSNEISTESTPGASTLMIQSNTGTSLMSSAGINAISIQLSTDLMPGATTAMIQSSTGTNPMSSTGMNSVTTSLSSIQTSGASTAMTQSRTGTSPTASTGSSSTKITASRTTSMTLPPTGTNTQPCAVVRPGCVGTYPDCHSCIKTCIEYMDRTDISGPPVYLWPEGYGPDSVPIFVECQGKSLILMERDINLTSRTEIKNYALSLYDMYRLIQLNAYPYLRFTFQTSFRPNESISSLIDLSTYKDVVMSPNGTLSNLTYYTSYDTTVDIFNLQGQPMKPTPFVNVTDDRYGCGSFWLLDATNATYCPGGTLGMFGTLRTNGTQVVNTGIRVPTNLNGTVYRVKVFLVD